MILSVMVVWTDLTEMNFNSYSNQLSSQMVHVCMPFLIKISTKISKISKKPMCKWLIKHGKQLLQKKNGKGCECFKDWVFMKSWYHMYYQWGRKISRQGMQDWKKVHSYCCHCNKEGNHKKEEYSNYWYRIINEPIEYTYCKEGKENRIKEC